MAVQNSPEKKVEAAMPQGIGCPGLFFKNIFVLLIGPISEKWAKHSSKYCG
jgi:hypothetical protein